MKNRMIIIMVLSIVAIFGICFGVYNSFFNINSVPKGDYMDEFVSPDGSYTVKTYESNAALSATAYRCEVVDNNTNKSRNIYWGYRELSLEVVWESNEVVIINDRELNVRKDSYDWRWNR